MTTSGTTAWSMTARDLVRQALLEGQVISPGEEPDGSELTDCIVRLNGMLKSWQTKGAGLWLESSETATVLAAEDNVVLGASIREVVGARVVVSVTHQRPLSVWERDDYLTIPNKASASLHPIAVYPSKQLGAITLYVWPVPTANATLTLDVLRGVETVTDASETLDFPQEYQETVYLNLALRCAPLFGEEPSAFLIARARELERQMLDAERPESYFMGPSYYSKYHG